ncbi:tellurite resistance/C4-dicarboxylate transporter family protein [Halorubrum sp. AD140]|uniref:tellurite resistance/C4-dicarboxylate transporter family protein n=1 Tax=Halorubrum sp. AD140 TaxID=3050073 RepID=UPI002ACC4477|nr:tellurite resistance/C4-dicarboxylate transporter family protein [Halorubrum sp. AD140]MDZ5809756.1 tellurite resistance/C4-dicarboxylate transporter family protein [Halorubrum sp. AD140]
MGDHSETNGATTDERPSVGGRLNGALRALDPAYFGLVMSTGIVSIAFLELGVPTVARPLAVFNVGCYALLLALFAAKAVAFPERMLADLRDRNRHWGALTFVVATNTVGVQVLLFSDGVAVAAALWGVTAVVTPALLYYLFATEFIGSGKTDVSERVDGAFLLVIVCMQSLAVLGGLLAEPLAGYANALVLLSMSYFGSGYVLYFVVVTVVTYRLLNGPIRPDDWTGPYWITMGAAAITTLAGTTLGPRLETVPGWGAYAPVIVGVTFLAWTIASWWIPLLLALDGWKFLTDGTDGDPPAWVVAFPWSRLGLGRRLHAYGPTAWGRVFPMGMYAACTLNLAGIGTFGLLSVVPAYWGWFALGVWALTLVGTVRAAADVLVGDPWAEASDSA